jgi:hypothetical protein
MLLAIRAVERLGVLGDRIDNEKIGRHGMFLTLWVAFARGI